MNNQKKLKNMVTVRLRLIAASMLAAGLAACGAPAQPNTSVATQPSAAAHISVQPPVSTPGGRDPQETPVPIEPRAVKLNATSWIIPQPHNVAPRIAANARGVLWVLFPPMITNDTIVRYAMDAMPRGEYQLVYTPFRPEGGDATRGAQLIMRVPSVIGNQNVRVGHPSAAGRQHFLFSTYELAQNAVTGGTSRMYWIDPQRGTVEEIFQAKLGGGAFLTAAQNDTWLFWNSYRMNEISQPVDNVQAFLFNLDTGEKRAINLGGTNVANSAEWRADGTLSFTTGYKQKAYVFDPATGAVVAQP